MNLDIWNGVHTLKWQRISKHNTKSGLDSKILSYLFEKFTTFDTVWQLVCFRILNNEKNVYHVTEINNSDGNCIFG